MQLIRIIMADYKVIEMDLSYKWWDKCFVVADLTIDILLHDYNYFSMTSVYLLSQGVRVITWKVLGPGDDNSESINTLKVYCP